MEKVTALSLAKIKSLSDLKISTDGKYGAFVLSKMSINDNKYYTNIYLIDLKTHYISKLTGGNYDKDISWLDNETILFRSKREEKEDEKKNSVSEFYKINIFGGEAQYFKSFPFEVSDLFILENKILCVAVLPCDFNKDKFTSENYIQYIEQNVSQATTMFDEIPFWFNGKGIINKKRQRLLEFDVKTGYYIFLSSQFLNVKNLIFNKDKSYAYYYGENYQDVMERKSELYYLDLQSLISIEKEFKEDFYINELLILNDKLILYGNLFKNLNSYLNPSFYLYDKGYTIKLNDIDDHIGATVSTDVKLGKSHHISLVNDNVYYFTTIDFSSVVKKINQTGEVETILKFTDGAIFSIAINKKDLYFLGAYQDNLVELFKYNLKNEELIQLSNFNASFFKEHYVSPVINMTFLNREKELLSGFIVLPLDYDENKKYPGILSIRGGPKAISGKIFFHEIQLLAQAGYVMFYCNPRGSDGKGSEFANIEKELYGVADYNDLMDFTDEILKRYPNIDKSNLGITGGSYGGFMTNLAIGKTNRFKAALSERSIASYITKTLTTDIGYYHNSAQISEKSIWDDILEYWNHSPLSLVPKIKTPLYLIHSDEDYRCYLGDVIQFFTALKLQGNEVYLQVFHKENHDLSRSGQPQNRLLRLQDILKWWDKQLKKTSD